jgi:hypothetical protein
MRPVNRKTTAFLLAISLCTGIIACGRSDGAIESDRNIIVDELNGTASVASADNAESDAYKGRQLISGDVVTVATDSDMTLKIDEDKHVFADSDTRFAIEATGKKKATETKITVAEGCTLIGIDNKLGDAETFNVSTPNATMAVRGTVFKVEVSPTAGGTVTRLEVLEGTVEVSTVEAGAVRTESVSEGGSAVYSGTAPDKENGADQTAKQADQTGRIGTQATKQQADQQAAQSANGIDSMDDIPTDRDGSKGFVGVYRGDGCYAVIAENVPYAYNRADGTIIDNEIKKPFYLVVSIPSYPEPFFARDAEKKSDTLITDYTYRDDENVHVMDAEYYLDGDTLYYHKRLNEDDYDEYHVMYRTDEDPSSVYMSLTQ